LPLSIDFGDQLRQVHVPLARDFLQPVPECILEAHARFVATDHDRALEDQRFHEDTPFVLNSTAQLFPLRALGAARIHRPSIQYSGVVLRSCPPEYPGPLTSSILGGSTGTAIFFRPIRNCRAVSPVCHTAGQADRGLRWPRCASSSNGLQNLAFLPPPNRITQFMAAKASTTLRLLTLIKPMPG